MGLEYSRSLSDYFQTGEYRKPRQGEFFKFGTKRAMRASRDYGSSYYILVPKPVLPAQQVTLRTVADVIAARDGKIITHSEARALLGVR